VEDSASLEGTITRVRVDSVMHGFACQKFEFVIDSTQNGQVTGYMWVAPELAYLRVIWAHVPDMGFFRQLEGFPVHIFLQDEFTTGQQFNAFTLRTVEREKLAARDFKLPDNYDMLE